MRARRQTLDLSVSRAADLILKVMSKLQKVGLGV